MDLLKQDLLITYRKKQIHGEIKHSVCVLYVISTAELRTNTDCNITIMKYKLNPNIK